MEIFTVTLSYVVTSYHIRSNAVLISRNHIFILQAAWPGNSEDTFRSFSTPRFSTHGLVASHCLFYRWTLSGTAVKFDSVFGPSGNELESTVWVAGTQSSRLVIGGFSVIFIQRNNFYMSCQFSVSRLHDQQGIKFIGDARQAQHRQSYSLWSLLHNIWWNSFRNGWCTGYRWLRMY